MKNLTVDGRLGKDAELGTTSGGTQYVRFSLATSVYENKQEKTEWLDITSYDPFVINHQIKMLKKGSYVIVNGKFRTDVNIKNGSVYLNQYVTANCIDIPALGGGKKEDTDTASVSVYNTQKSAPAPETPMSANNYKEPSLIEPDDDDDDLPF